MGFWRKKIANILFSYTLVQELNFPILVNAQTQKPNPGDVGTLFGIMFKGHSKLGLHVITIGTTINII